MGNIWVEAVKEIAKKNGITLREAADRLIAALHKRYDEVIEEERSRSQFGQMPDQYDPDDDFCREWKPEPSNETEEK